MIRDLDGANFLRAILRALVPLFLFAPLCADTLTFKGNHHLKTTRLRSLFDQQDQTLYALFNSSLKFDENAIANIKALYRTEGFYQTDITLEQNNTHYTFNITEGQPIRISAIEIKSNIDINRFITQKPNQRFTQAPFKASKHAITDYLLSRGFCSYNFDAKTLIDVAHHTATIRYELNSQSPCEIGSIDFNNQTQIDDAILLGLLRFRVGDRFSLQAIKASYSALYALEAIETVYIDYSKKINNIIDVRITTKAKSKTRRFRVGLGYEQNEGTRFLMNFEHLNILGNAQKLSIEAKHSADERTIELGLFTPQYRASNRALDLNQKLGFNEREHLRFDEKSIWARAYAIYHANAFDIDGGVSLEAIKINNAQCGLKNGDYLLFYPFVHLIIDRRNDALNPTKGFYSALYAQIGSGANTSHYLKLLHESRLIYSHNSYLLALRTRLGVIDTFKNATPPSQLFLGGGLFSNRAYGYEMLGASDADCEAIGAKTWLELGIETNIPTPIPNLKGALFADMSKLSQKSYNFNTPFVVAMGLGARYISPIGVFKADFGVDIKNPNQRQLNITLGQSF